MIPLFSRNSVLTFVVGCLAIATFVGNWRGVGELVARAENDLLEWGNKGFRGNGTHTDAPREMVEKHVAGDESLYYRPCSQDGRLTPAERSTHLALSWAMSPAPVRFGDEKDCAGASSIVVSRFLNIRIPGYWLAAENGSDALWKRDEMAPDSQDAKCNRRQSVSPLRELTVALVACLLVGVFALLVFPRGSTPRLSVWRMAAVCIGSFAFFAFAAGVALSHTFMAPTGLGVYGGKAKLLYLAGSIPRGFFTDSAYSSYQPAYPPGLALLTSVAYLVAGGCGEWLTQIIPVFATALAMGIVLASGECSIWMSILICAAFAGEQALTVSTYYYAEPFVALLVILGWSRIRNNGHSLPGWFSLGLAGLFKTEGLVLLFAVWLSMLICASRMEGEKSGARTLPGWWMRLVLAAALPLAWHAGCRIAGARFYDYASVWEIDIDRLLAAAKYLLKIAYLEPWRFEFAYPVALIIAIFSVMKKARTCFPKTMIAAASASLFCLVAFVWIYSYSRASDFEWHLWSSAARLLWVPSLLVLMECSITLGRVRENGAV